MKKQFSLLLAALFVTISSLMAQGGMQRQTPEERVKATMEKILVLELTEDQTKKTTIVITDFVNSQQKTMEELRSGGTDREGWMTKRKELEDNRDKKLKEIFTADQFKKWIDEIVPSMRPQRSN